MPNVAPHQQQPQQQQQQSQQTQQEVRGLVDAVALQAVGRKWKRMGEKKKNRGKWREKGGLVLFN